MNYLMARAGAIATLLIGLAACSDGSGISGVASGVGGGSSAGNSGVVSSSPIGGGSGGTTNGQSICPSGVSACSGEALGVSVGNIQLSKNGLQTIGFSTSDLLPTNNNTAEAYGLMPTNEGFAELRVLHDTDANISAVDLLLSQLKLLWDGRTERPQIIENFGLKRGRV